MSRLTIAFILLLSMICLRHPSASQAGNTPVAGNLTSSVTAALPTPTKKTGNVNEISLFALSRDGRLAVTADEDENNYIWDVKSGALIRELGKPEAVRIRVVAAAFSPESSQLLWARNGKIMPILWDVESGRRIGVLSSKENGHTANIVAATFSSDGRYIATGDSQGTVVIWNRAARSVVRRISAHTGEARYLFFIPGKNELATAGADGAVRLWGLFGPEALATLLEPSDDAVTALTGSADGRFLYAALDDMTVKGWTVSLRRLRGTLDFNNRQINSIAVSPDGDFMALAEEDESVLLWNIRESRVAWKSDLDNSVTQVVFSPDGKRLFAAGGDNWVREWDVASGHLMKKFGGVN
ncbi:MAG: WD40 repeat domain-containing protein [Pelobacteraceae bacterium]